MTTPCPDLGTWRAALDGETSVEGTDEHLATCAACATLVAELRTDADFAREQMTVLAGTRRVALAPVASVAATTAPETPTLRRRPGWWTGLAAAAAAGVFLATPVGQQTAQAVLSSFRVEQFSLVQVTGQQLVETAGVLSSLGTVDGGVAFPDLEPVSVAEAEAATGLDLPAAPSLEDRPAEAFVVPASRSRWTLDEDAVADYLTANGAEVDIPAGLDGTTLVLERSDALAAVYGRSTARPDVVVAMSGPVSLDVARGGLSLPEVREFLLSVPGLPDSLVSQLTAIDDWQSTLPVPIPVDEASAQTVQLNGTEAVTVEVDGAGSAYLWVDDGTSVLVAGPSGSDLVRAVADELAP